MQEKNPACKSRFRPIVLPDDNLLAYSANYRLRSEYVEDLKLRVHEMKPQPASMTTCSPSRHLQALARLAGENPTGCPSCVCTRSRWWWMTRSRLSDRIISIRVPRTITPSRLLVEDAAFAAELRTEIEIDMRPENSWTIGGVVTAAA